MKNILLVCAAGMSTSLLVNKMKDAAKAKGIEININALPVSECSSVVDTVDIVLLGPQVKYLYEDTKKKFADLNKPIFVIDSQDYGVMNGEKVLKTAIMGYKKHIKENA